MIEVNSDPVQPVFWQQAWKAARKNSISERRNIRSDQEIMKYWNQVASEYDQVHSDCKKNRRVERIINLLQKEKYITRETKILDIGCGTGTYSLPFAEICKKVTALDGAEEMCRHLERKVSKYDIDNLEVLHRMWEDVDLEKEFLLKQHDLVFASMTPAVFDFETLEKMNQASLESCCLIFWAKDGTNQVIKDLWKEIFNEDVAGYNTATIIYPFNLLYSLGYFPKIQYIDTCWSFEEPLEDAVESLCNMFWLYTEITPPIKDTVKRYVYGKAENNLFNRKTEARLGIVTWNVDRQLYTREPQESRVYSV